MDQTLEQHYAFWKHAVHACMQEMDGVLAGTQGGGRLLSAAVSMEFAWDLLRAELEQRLDAQEMAGDGIFDQIELHLPGRI